MEAGDIASQHAASAGANFARAFLHKPPLSAYEIQGSIDGTLGRSTIEGLKEFVDPLIAPVACFSGITPACGVALVPTVERLLNTLKNLHLNQEREITKDTIIAFLELIPWPGNFKGLILEILVPGLAEKSFEIYDEFKTKNTPITPEYIETQNYNVRKFKK